MWNNYKLISYNDRTQGYHKHYVSSYKSCSCWRVSVLIFFITSKFLDYECSHVVAQYPNSNLDSLPASLLCYFFLSLQARYIRPQVEFVLYSRTHCPGVWLQCNAQVVVFFLHMYLFSPNVPLYQRWLGIFGLLDPTCRLQSSPALCLGINVTLCQSFLKTQWRGQMTSNLWMTAIWDFVRSLLIQMLVALLACTWKRSCQSINYDVPV